MKKVNIWATILVAIALMCVSCDSASTPREMIESLASAVLKGNYVKAAEIECKMKGEPCSDEEFESNVRHY